MYVYERPVELTLGALSEPDDVLLEQSKAAIMAALKRNPVGGYTVGSAARKALEDGFKSVPKGEAVKLHIELNNGQTPLARLFRYRLATKTRQTMKAILQDKEFKWIEEMKQLREQIRKQMCEGLKAFESSVETVCQTSSEDSDACQKARFELLSARERNNMQGTRCP